MKKYSIYQIKDEHQNGRYVKYMGLDFVKENDLCEMEGNLCKLDVGMYDKVYESEIDDSQMLGVDSVLDYLYEKFNIAHPSDFRGHSLSVSDVIVLDGTAYYVDSYGFEEIDF